MRTAAVRVTERYWAGGTGWRAGSASPPGPCRPGGRGGAGLYLGSGNDRMGHAFTRPSGHGVDRQCRQESKQRHKPVCALGPGSATTGEET